MEEKNYTPNEILDTAMEIGMNLLKSGAEIRRVEQTITYISKAYGATEVDVFALPSLIVATIQVDDETYTSKVKRNHVVSTDLFRLEKYNKLSRYIVENKPSLEEVKEKVNQIQGLKDYNTLLMYLGSILAATGFAMFFGGTYRDAIAAGLVSIVMTLFNRLVKQTFNPMVHTLICSLIGGFFSVVTCWIGLSNNLSYVMIGAIMIIIPGLSIGTSIRDIMSDDVLSGSIRLFQALVTASAIAAGFSIWTKVYGGEVGMTDSAPMYIMLIASVIGTLAYGILFNNKYKHLPYICVSGLLTCLMYVFALQFTNGNIFLSVMLGSMVSTLIAEILARLLKAPTTVFLLPSIISLVPGASLFFTMYYIINGDFTAFGDSLSSTLLASLGIAVGIIIVSVFVQIVFKIHQKIHKAW